MIIILKLKRHIEIEKLVRSVEYMMISDISSQLKVSESTIRRDLKEMSDKGLITVHQGAVIWNSKENKHHENIFYRKAQQIDKKRELAIVAVELINQGDVLYIDTGSTMLELVKSIDAGMLLTVVTNDLEIAMELENKPNISIIILGGQVKHGTHTVIFNPSNQMLDYMHFDKMFISPGGITKEGGLMFFNIQALEERKKIRKASREMIVVMDSSKFDKNCFISGFQFSECSTLVTDEISHDWKRHLVQHMRIITPAASTMNDK